MKKLLAQAAVLGAVVTAVVGGTVSPASAATNVTSCSAYDEVCSVSIYSTGGFIAFSSSFPGWGGTAPYRIWRGNATLCSGTMGLNDTSSCTISGSGTITFKLYKGQNATGNISINSY